MSLTRDHKDRPHAAASVTGQLLMVGHVILINSWMCLAVDLILLLTIPSRLANAFDARWHVDATRIAMEKNGFSKDATTVTQFSNYLVDFCSNLNPDRSEFGIDNESFSYMHFDSLLGEKDFETQWERLERNTKAALTKFSSDPSIKPGYRPIVLLNIIGSSQHCVQDFYSHSNWVRLHSSVARVPIWFEVPPRVRSKYELKSGKYPDDASDPEGSHMSMNIDCSQRPLHSQAFDVSTRASIDWVKRLISTEGIDWKFLKSYKLDNNPLTRNRLEADITFLVASSYIVQHWDGKKPVSNPYHTDDQRSRKIAMNSLNMVALLWEDNKSIKENTYKLPTEFWCGFLAYHIQHQISLGLKLYVHNFEKGRWEESVYKPPPG